MCDVIPERRWQACSWVRIIAGLGRAEETRGEWHPEVPGGGVVEDDGTMHIVAVPPLGARPVAVLLAICNTI